MSFTKVQDRSITPKNYRSDATYLRGKWVRNPSWLPLASVTSSDQKFSGLYLVTRAANFVSFICSVNTGSTYSIDWGDGTSTETVTGGTQAYHEYSYSDSDLNGTDGPVTFTDSGDTVNRTAHGYVNGMTISFATVVTTTGISAGQIYYVVGATANTFQVSATEGGSAIALTTDGSGTILPYKQAVITVTPTGGGANLTEVNLYKIHNQSGLNNGYATGWLDLAIAASCTTLTIGNSGGVVIHRNLQQVDILKSNTTTFASLFYACTSLQNIISINSSASVTSTLSMFQTCFSLTSVPLFTTSSVTTMASMFSECGSLINVPVLDTGAVTNMSGMFLNCFDLREVPFFKTNSVTTMANMFQSCYNLKKVPLFNTAAVTDMTNMFTTCRSLEELPLFNTASVTLLSSSTSSSIFTDCSSLKTIPAFNFAAVTDCRALFYGCISLKSTPALNLSAATSFINMFLSCASLVKVGPITSTTALTNCQTMFSGCSSLVSVPLFTTTNVTTTQNMFSNCRVLQSVPLYTTSAVTTFQGMFQNCTALHTIPLFSTTALTTTGMNSFLSGCSSISYVPAIAVGGVTSASGYTSMFSNCTSLSKIDMTGHKYTFTVATLKLSGTELDNLYTNLATVTSQTITVTSNYGTTSDTPTIATGKGWSVTGS